MAYCYRELAISSLALAASFKSFAAMHLYRQ